MDYEGFEDLDNWFMTSNDGNPIDNLLTGLVSTLSSSFQSGFGGSTYYTGGR